jgi:type I restriction enzyme M protein
LSGSTCHPFQRNRQEGKEKNQGWTCDRIPKPFNVDLYYAEEQTIIDQLNIQLESITAKVADLEDEHGGEEGVLAELATR